MKASITSVLQNVYKVLCVALTAASEAGVAYVNAREGAWLSKQVYGLDQVLIFVDELQTSKMTEYHLDLMSLISFVLKFKILKQVKTALV